MIGTIILILVFYFVYLCFRWIKKGVVNDNSLENVADDLLNNTPNDLLDNVKEHIEAISNIEDKEAKAMKFEALKKALRIMEFEETRKSIAKPDWIRRYSISVAIGHVKIAAEFADIRAEYTKKGKILDVVVNNILTLLLADEEVKNMGRNLIAEMPEWFYIDECTLLYVDSIVGSRYEYPSQSLLLLPSEYDRDKFIDGKRSLLTESCKEVAGVYLTDTLSLFQIIAFSDKSYITKDVKVQYVIAYNVINRLVIEHFSEGQERNFPGLAELSLDKAIEQFCFSNAAAEQEKDRFIYFLMKYKKFDTDNHSFPKCKEVFMVTFDHFMGLKKIHDLSNRLKRPRTSSYTTIEEIDLMTGQQFEHFIAELFLKMGYKTEVTQTSGDQGIDVIASKNGSKIGIQAKCYSSSVGNGAVQEAVAGRAHYKLDRVMVITNHFFTVAAKKLAQSNAVILWDRDVLKEKL